MIKGNFVKDPFTVLLRNKEPVFQKVSLSFSKVKEINSDFDVNYVEKISFIFGELIKGEIYLRDI